MAVNHMLYTPEQLATSTLAALRNRSTLARIINQDYSKEFVPGRGATVTVKSPVRIDKARVYTAEDRAAEKAITYSDLYEPFTSIKLTDQVYQAVKLPDDFATFTLLSMEQQVVAPMAESVAEKLNEIVGAAFDTVKAGLSVADKADKGKIVDSEGGVHADIAALRAAKKFPIATGLGLSGAQAAVKDAHLTANTHGRCCPLFVQLIAYWGCVVCPCKAVIW
ncbi:hypothetical protein GP475_08795 [Corynebacterium poyangense]|uniref:P22 coat protein-gene protein 5 n=1 Tax=Corynebacterium poyangense TaxID=2684405 RepID=A0A7H0SQ99_9CORY|nr:hypothetical protein [Corynebacterium poyangense]QNQ90724.1 hypothetical protein GP475_08795 [Corynebacterium poyangense]